MTDKILWQSKGSDVVHTIPAHAVVTVITEKSKATIEIIGDDIVVNDYIVVAAELEKMLIHAGLPKKTKEK